MMSEITPCFDCVGKAELMSDEEDGVTYFVECTKCGLYLGIEYCDKQYAIEEWNDFMAYLKETEGKG
jgi:Zn ribbon nucleic-acid-binding protein